MNKVVVDGQEVILAVVFDSDNDLPYIKMIPLEWVKQNQKILAEWYDFREGTFIFIPLDKNDPEEAETEEDEEALKVFSELQEMPNVSKLESYIFDFKNGKNHFS